MAGPHVAELRRRIAAIERRAPHMGETAAGDAVLACAPLGIADADARLGGGLVRGDLHEVGGSAAQAGAAAGFALALAARLMAGSGKPMLWVQQAATARETGAPYAPGLRLFGIAPDRLMTVRPGSARDALWAAEEGLACRALALVLAELRDARAVSLLASRRLRLAARASGVTALLLLDGVDGFASAAGTRWRVAPLPSAGMQHGPGLPRWRVALQKNRTGRLGAWTLEWNPDEHAFLLPPAHPGAVAEPSCDRPDHAQPAPRVDGRARRAG